MSAPQFTKRELETIKQARLRLAAEAKRLQDIGEKYRFCGTEVRPSDADLTAGYVADLLWKSGCEAVNIAVRISDQVLPALVNCGVKK